ncbi:MAG: DUF3024 domain-containing protein [Desulfobacteraceae bacterium]|nr:DUF3024 domain-containing protein [Desulfobacteraceae bacterium]
MALIELDRRRVERLMRDYCERRVPPQAQDSIRLDFVIRGQKITLIESRPAFRQPGVWVELKIAQFEFDGQARNWRLYCYDRNSKRRAYLEGSDESPRLENLLQEVDADPLGIFWG